MTAPEPIDWKAWIIAAIAILLFLLALGGCQPEEQVFQQPDVKAMPMKTAPLTVTPNPKFGFDLVIVPAGTKIDGFITTQPGLYIAGDALRGLLRDMGLVGDYRESVLND